MLSSPLVDLSGQGTAIIAYIGCREHATMAAEPTALEFAWLDRRGPTARHQDVKTDDLRTAAERPYLHLG
jgi:hypothetical protein